MRAPADIDAFIAHWRDTGGSELANTQSFINGLCHLLGIDAPAGSRTDDKHNDYVFERRVFQDNGDGTQSFGRIDCYKRSCFILEAKQGSEGDRAAAAKGEDDLDLFGQTASARVNIFLRPKRQVWNAGRTVGAKRALKPKQIWEIRFYLNQRRRLRDRALFDLAIDSKLRGCDLVQMKIGDLVSGGQIRTRAIVMQKKTGRPVQFELLPDARNSLLAWLERRGGTVNDYVFPSRIDHSGHLSTRQYARLVDEWVTGVGLMRSEYGTHSLRRTKASIIYRATGNLRAVQILLGHSKIENTVRYLGIDVEDALALAENTEI